MRPEPVEFSLLTNTSGGLLVPPSVLSKAPGVVGAIDGDAASVVITGPSEEGRVVEARVDDELVIRPVACAHREPVGSLGTVGLQHVAALHRYSLAVELLVGQRRRVPKHSH